MKKSGKETPALFLIALTRFLGFSWLIIAGFMLPKAMTKELLGKRFTVLE